jgi:hypothetical protein
MSVMEIIGLKVREIRYKPDPCLDCVVEQLYKGEPIAPNARIRKGESIVLVLGAGERGGRVPVPELAGLTLAECGQVLTMASLNRGVVVECVGCNTRSDSAFARVHRQSPQADAGGFLPMGGSIDLWLTTDTAGLRPRHGWNDPVRYQHPDSAHASN